MAWSRIISMGSYKPTQLTKFSIDVDIKTVEQDKEPKKTKHD